MFANRAAREAGGLDWIYPRICISGVFCLDSGANKHIYVVILWMNMMMTKLLIDSRREAGKLGWVGSDHFHQLGNLVEIVLVVGD